MNDLLNSREGYNVYLERLIKLYKNTRKQNRSIEKEEYYYNHKNEDGEVIKSVKSTWHSIKINGVKAHIQSKDLKYFKT